MTSKIFKKRFHVPYIVNQIRTNDVIKLRAEIDGQCVSLYEMNGRIFGLGLPDHHRGEVDSYSIRGLYSCQEVTTAATDLQHALARGNKKPIDLSEPLLIKGSQWRPQAAFLRGLTPIAPAVLGITEALRSLRRLAEVAMSKHDA